MKKLIYTAILGIATLYASEVYALSGLSVVSSSIGKDGMIAPIYAFCALNFDAQVDNGVDRSVGLAWSPGPEGTKSYVVIAVDTDVPTDFTYANRLDRTLPASMKRQEFYHWVLYDIPPSITAIPAGADSRRFEIRGKFEPKTPYGTRGVNDYAAYFKNDKNRSGSYMGYDGPCPPSNDELMHHYHFRVFALNVKSLGLSTMPPSDGRAVMVALKDHVLAWGEVVGKFTLNRGIPH